MSRCPDKNILTKIFLVEGEIPPGSAICILIYIAYYLIMNMDQLNKDNEPQMSFKIGQEIEIKGRGFKIHIEDKNDQPRYAISIEDTDGKKLELIVTQEELEKLIKGELAIDSWEANYKQDDSKVELSTGTVVKFPDSEELFQVTLSAPNGLLVHGISTGKMYFRNREDAEAVFIDDKEASERRLAKISDFK